MIGLSVLRRVRRDCKRETECATDQCHITDSSATDRLEKSNSVTNSFVQVFTVLHTHTSSLDFDTVCQNLSSMCAREKHTHTSLRIAALKMKYRIIADLWPELWHKCGIRNK